METMGRYHSILFKCRNESCEDNKLVTSSKQVSWDLDCDYPGIKGGKPSLDNEKQNCYFVFSGNDIGNNKTLSTKCGKLCIDNPNCKYFAWSSGICYLKNRHDKKQFFDGSVCGFVKDRVKNATELTVINS